MLSYMRENTGSWIIKILLGLIVLVFVFLGMGSFNSKRGDTVASVNDVPITFDEYQRSYQDILEQLRRQFGDNLNDDLLKMFQVKKQALDRLIEQALIAGEAEDLNIKTTKAELRSSLMNIPAFQRNGVFDMATYKRVLAANRFTPEGFELMQINSLTQSKVRDFVLSNVKVSDLEAGEWYRYNKTRVGIDYLLFDPAVYTDIEADNEKIASYYELNKKNYTSPARIRVQYLRYAPEDFKDQLNIPDDRCQAYYDENQSEFKTPEKIEASHILIKVADKASEDEVKQAEKRARELYEKAANGEDFAELAKKFSEGPSRDNGGYLGYFTRQDMVKPFADKAFSMNAGEVGEPVRTRFGWHVIKVASRQKAATTSFEMAKEDIRKRLQRDELKNLAYDKAAEASDAIVDGDDLEQAGLLTGVSVQESGFFDAQGKGLEMKNSRAFAKAAFTLSSQEVSDAKEVGDDYFIIKIVERREPEILALDKVRSRVEKDLLEKLRDEKAEKEAGDALAALDGKKSLKDLTLKRGMTVLSTKPFTRDEQLPELGRNQDIIEAAFSLTMEKPVYDKVLKGPAGYYVIAFREKIVPDQDETARALAEVKPNLLKTKKGQVMASWIRELKKKGKIEIKPGFLD